MSIVPVVPVRFRYPSQHAGSDSYPGRISWEALATGGPGDSCTLAFFLTGSAWPKPGTLGQNLAHLVKTWHTWPKPGTLGQNLAHLAKTWHTWPKPGTVSQNSIGCGLVLYHSIVLSYYCIIRDVCGRTEPSLKVGNW